MNFKKFVLFWWHTKFEEFDIGNILLGEKSYENIFI